MKLKLRFIAMALIVAIALIAPGCTQKTNTNPQTGTSTTQQVVTDDSLKQVTAQVERAVEGLQIVGAAKRAAFKAKIITARQSRAITLPSLDAEKVLGEVKAKLDDYAALDEAARTELRPLLNSVVGITGAVATAVTNNLTFKDNATRERVQSAIKQLSDSAQKALNLVQ